MLQCLQHPEIPMRIKVLNVNNILGNSCNIPRFVYKQSAKRQKHRRGRFIRVSSAAPDFVTLRDFTMLKKSTFLGLFCVVQFCAILRALCSLADVTCPASLACAALSSHLRNSITSSVPVASAIF